MEFLHNRFILGFICLIVIDQTSKFFAKNFTQIYLNSGISLGIFEKFSWQILSAIVVFFLVAVLFLLRDLVAKRPFIMGVLFGSAVSNVIDRLLHGAVVDWLSVPFVGLHNNIADWGITIALMWLVLTELGSRKNAT